MKKIFAKNLRLSIGLLYYMLPAPAVTPFLVDKSTHRDIGFACLSYCWVPQ